MLSAFEERSLALSFMYILAQVFRSAPPAPTKEYNAWLDKVQPQRKEQWENLDIYDMVEMSRTGPRYNLAMLLASIFLWEGSINTF